MQYRGVAVTMILCVGSTGCGKSSLLKLLQQKSQSEYIKATAGKEDPNANKPNPDLPPDYIPSTISTVGTDLITLPAKPKGKSSGGNQVTTPQEVVVIREVGGCMAPIWSSYVEPGRTNAIMYVVDASCPEKIATATIHLVELLNHGAMANTAPVMIIFSKSDLKSARSVTEIQYLMRLDHILRQGLNVQLIEHTTFNVVTKENMDKIYEWCMKFTVSGQSHQSTELV